MSIHGEGDDSLAERRGTTALARGVLGLINEKYCIGAVSHVDLTSHVDDLESSCSVSHGWSPGANERGWVVRESSGLQLTGACFRQQSEAGSQLGR